MAKLVRQIEGHKFYSQAWATKEEAESNQQNGFSATYLDGYWYNYGGAGGNSWQEDTHEAP